MTLNRQKYQGFLLIAVLLMMASAALVVDVPIARAFRRWNDSRPIANWLGNINFFEIFGHGLGVVVFLVMLHQLDRSRRWAIPRIMACVLAAGGLANLLKMFVVRTRPYGWDLGGDVWATFGGWFTTISTRNIAQSFPSAHTATAVAFAAAMAWFYPQGRRLFFVLAVLVGCQRIVCGAHYLSDVLTGAALGCIAAELFFHIGLLPGWFSRWEKSWQSK